MKKIFLFITLICAVTLSQAQAPQKMSYQAVVRNGAGNLVANTATAMRITILQGTTTGTAVFQETHNATTNANGLVSVEIGGGNVLTGSFAEIAWANGPYFIKAETDPDGGTNYTITGTSQLLSVPYAQYAETSGHQGKTSIYFTGDITDAQAAAKMAAEFGPNTENIIIFDTTQLTSLDLTAVTTLVTLRIMTNNSLTAVNLSGLTTVFEALHMRGNGALTVFSLPAVVYINDVQIDSNAALTTVSLPSLTTTAANFFYIIGNPQLASIEIPSFTNLRGGILNFAGNALPTPEINELLHQFLSVTSSNGLNLTLENQNPPAPPSGQGIIDKQTLIDNGHTVYTD